MLMTQFDVWMMNTQGRKKFLNTVAQTFYKEFFSELKDKSILEIGCGAGFGAETILKYFKPKRIIATDLDSRLVSIAKKNVQAHEVTFEVADATKLSYPDNSFEAFFDFGVIHHIPNPEWKHCLDEAYRVLKPNGKIFLCDVSIDSFNETIFSKLIRLFTLHPYDKMYAKNEFITYLKQKGFEILKEEAISRNFLKYFVIVAKK